MAVVPVHVYGNICNVEAIADIAYRYGLKVIYDTAHAFGVEYQGRGIGSFGDASIFSFHATKIYHTIEGGAVAFNDPSVYDRLYTLKNFGIQGEELVTGVGANAKMNEFQAIMGICNLKYRNEKACNNYAYLPILIEDAYGSSRDELYLRLREHGVYARKYFYPLTSDQVCFKNKYRGAALNQSRSISRQVMVLPLYEDLELESIKKIIHIIKRK